MIDSLISGHAHDATRMLPGGMFVLGIFIVSENVTPFEPKFESMLLHIYKELEVNKFMYGNPSSTERIILNYCASNHQYICKSYDVVTRAVKPAEIKFQSNLNVANWVQLSCRYELEHVFFITQEHQDWSLKEQLNVSIKYL